MRKGDSYGNSSYVPGAKLTGTDSVEDSLCRGVTGSARVESIHCLYPTHSAVSVK